MADFGNTENERFKFDINGDWTLSYGDNAPADLVADQGGADIKITQGQGTYRIELNGNTKVYSVAKVTVGGLDPVADAGPDQTLTLAASIVQLNGSGSSDPDGTITAHLWTQIAGPAAVLSSATAANPTVSIPANPGPRIYSFMLKVTDNGTRTDVDTVTVRQAPPSGTWQRTVFFIFGQTQPGQDLSVRGGIDHTYANANLGRDCRTTNFECAMPIRHLNLRNTTTAPLKANDSYLDWYGKEAAQNINAVGSPADWTTDVWPAAWGPKKTVAVDGHGEEPLNVRGQHYWMLDVEMDCSKAVNGWFEVKSFISNGPGWEPDLVQPGAPYVTGNHFAKCGEINRFKRGLNTWEHTPF